MNLQDLIKNNKIITLSKPLPLNKTRDEFNRGSIYFENTKKLIQEDGFNEEFIYKNLYDSIRKMCDAIIKSEGYRAKGKDHHKSIIKAIKFILNRSDLETEFIRLEKMSTIRNKIEYNILTLSFKELEQAVKDGEKIREVLEKYLNEKDNQQGLKV